MIGYSHLKEAWRIFSRARHVKKHGFRGYQGKPEEIAAAIVRDCFNGTYFQVSTGHFSQFYCRDFGICAEPLARLGYRDEIHRTLQYALHVFATNGRISTTISLGNRPIDIFSYAPDSLAFLMHSLRVSGAQELVEIYRPFLEKQVEVYFQAVFDERTGLVRKDRRFSSMKDNSVRRSSCYDNCMVSMLSDELGKLGLRNPFKGYDLKKNIMEHFWTGSYFLDDLSGRTHVAGDAQVFAFWCGVCDDPKIFERALESIQKEGLDKPFPLQYTSSGRDTIVMWPLSCVLSSYETDTIWIHLGLCWMDVVKRFGKKELLGDYLDSYSSLIREHKTFLELYEADGSVFQKFHYVSDEGMLWVAKYLDLSGGKGRQDQASRK